MCKRSIFPFREDMTRGTAKFQATTGRKESAFHSALKELLINPKKCILQTSSYARSGTLLGSALALRYKFSWQNLVWLTPGK